MACKVFADTNVFLDAWLERTPEWKEAEAVLHLAAKDEIILYSSANNLINVIYLLRKEKITPADMVEVMDLALSYTQLSHTSNASFRQALRAGFSDLEDAVQYHTALDIKGINYFVTSNVKDYKKATGRLSVVSPKQFMAAYQKQF